MPDIQQQAQKTLLKAIKATYDKGPHQVEQDEIFSRCKPTHVNFKLDNVEVPPEQATAINCLAEYSQQYPHTSVSQAIEAILPYIMERNIFRAMDRFGYIAYIPDRQIYFNTHASHPRKIRVDYVPVEQYDRKDYPKTVSVCIRPVIVHREEHVQVVY